MERSWRTIIEPFKVKAVEPLGFTTRSQRQAILKKAGYNLFNVSADQVLIDLLTDSGTSAMSSEQWACLMRGDESYAGARSFFRFERVVRELTGYRHVLPVHQGRAAERILLGVLGGKGKVFLSNSHFDTTRANVEATGARAVDLPAPGALDFAKSAPFKGDIDLRALESELRSVGAKNVPMVIMTATNNSLGGQPVSMRNLREASAICRRRGVPLILDAARFAENAYLIKQREPGFSRRSAADIAREMFSLAQGCMMSAKKDALVNIGGFLALNDDEWVRRARELLILGEGFPTYGGLAGRDLEAMARGLEEVLDERYLAYRLRSVQYLGEGLRRHGVPIVEPPGGHAVYVDAKRFLPQIPPAGFPAQALVCELYLTAGLRAVEIGSLMFGRGRGAGFVPARMELVRLALPRRVYTQSHVDFVIEVFEDIAERAASLRPLRLVEAPAALRHFTARLAPAGRA
ncbi:MAG: tryptophanase [Elusimicrobia bacterium]|nr:tryptophanase [Elusimicrobiota bacterium]MDE2236614.1 tryptophanase [Elusimicrobiota bacterium]MDE2425152.1 tryptophanase [Elusimicrobiota bacterium]